MFSQTQNQKETVACYGGEGQMHKNTKYTVLKKKSFKISSNRVVKITGVGRRGTKHNEHGTILSTQHCYARFGTQFNGIISVPPLTPVTLQQSIWSGT